MRLEGGDHRDEGLGTVKRIPLKANVDAALEKVAVHKVLIVSHTNADISIVPGRDVRYGEAKHSVSDDCPCEPMNAEDPLFILYLWIDRKAQGVLHTTGGYLFWASWTHELVLDYRPSEIFWCTADVAGSPATSIAYGPLASGATTLMFKGVPNYPDHRRFWQVIDKHKAEIFYTAPAALRALRALMREGDAPVKATAASRCACSAASASRSIPKPGAGITRWSEKVAAPSSTPGGRPRPAASWSLPCPEPPT